MCQVQHEETVSTGDVINIYTTWNKHIEIYQACEQSCQLSIFWQADTTEWWSKSF